VIKVRFKSSQVDEKRRQELIREAETLGAVFRGYDPDLNELSFEPPPGMATKEFTARLAKNN